MSRILLSVVTSLGVVSAGISQDAPNKIDLSDPSLVFVDESVIPIPLEIFASLDKLGNQDWGKQVNEREVRLNMNRSRTAMLFGLVISEGFIAVQAKDKEAVKRIGREVLRLAQPLNVADQVGGHANAIMNTAAEGDWAQVRKELDKTRQTVLDQMRSNRDDDLVDLVSLGGWLGGTEALAAVLKSNYSVEASDLLNQPELVGKLKSDFNSLPRRVRKGTLFNQVGKTLAHLESLMKIDGNGFISEGKVIEISVATSNLVQAIYES